MGITSTGYALAAAVAADEWNEVERLIERHWSELAAFELEALIAALTALPDEVRERSPRWGPALAYAEHMARGDGAQYQDLAPATESAGLVDTLAELTSVVAGNRVASRFEDASRAALQARSVLESATRQEHLDAVYSLPHLAMEWGRAHELDGDDGAALEDYREAFDLGESLGDPLIAQRAAARLAWNEARAGRPDNADRWISRTDERLEQSSLFATPRTLAVVLGLSDRLLLAPAREELHLLSEPFDSEAWAEILFVKAQIATVDEALGLIEEIIARVSERPFRAGRTGTNAGLIAHSLMRLNLRLGSPGDALRALRDFPEDPATTVARMVAHLGLDDTRRVLELTDGIAEELSRSQRWRAIALVTESVAHWRMHNDEASARAVRRATEIIVLHQQYSALTVAPREEIMAIYERRLPGVNVLPQGVVFPNGPRVPISALSAKEYALLLELADGGTLEDVAARVFVSRNTVKTHLRSIYAKLGITTREEAIDIAREFTPNW